MHKKKIAVAMILVVFIVSGMLNVYQNTYSESVQIELSPLEQEFISGHSEIRIGFDPDFIPFEFRDIDGAYKGLCSDYVTLLNQRLGLNMVAVNDLSWEEAIKAIENKEIDVLPGVGITAERGVYLNFSEPYLVFQRAIYSKEGSIKYRNLMEIENVRVAVQKSSSHEGYLADNSEINPRLYDSAEEALLALSSGKVDAYVGNLSTSNYLVKALGIGNVIVSGNIGSGEGLSFGVRDDWPILVTILEKGLESISQEEKIEIYNKWIGVNDGFDKEVFYSILWKVVLGFFVLLGVSYYWLRILRLEIKERKKAQEDLNIALKQIESLYNSSIALVETLELSEVLRLIVLKLSEVVSFDYASIQELDDKTFKIIYTYGFDSSIDPIGKVSHMSEHPLQNHVILNKSPYVIGNVYFYYTPYDLENTDIVSCLILPLVFNDKVIGVLTLDHKKENHFSESIVKWSLAYAHQAAVALNNAQLFKDLKHAKDVAESATRAKGDFLANMSHEIRTPMNAIMGLTHLILRTDLDLKQRNYLTKVENASKNLLGIINDILDFSKIESGKLRIERISFDLDVVMRDLSDIISLKAGEKDIEILYDVDPKLPKRLLGDPLRLGQLLLNLTNNAIKFTDQGEVVVRIKEESVEGENICIRFDIEDTGIGIDINDIDKLFTSFEQADTSTTRKYGGTGLGLPICEKLVEMMGGSIQVSSVLGAGSIFSFTAQFGFQKEEVANVFALSPIFEAHRILVVDDNPNFLEVIGAYLEGINFSVVKAETGKKALKLLSENQNNIDTAFTVVFVDWKLETMTGIELTKAIRKEAYVEGTPKIVMVTGYGREDILNQVDQNNLDGLLIKPVTQSLLLDLLFDVIGTGAVTKNSVDGELTISKNAKMKNQEIEGASVLIVEDNEVNQLIVTDLLESNGISVQCASHGKEALDLLSENVSFDVVLMDIQMPVMDGYQATKAIRAMGGTMITLPIIAMTADAMEGAGESALEHGFTGYLSKPVDPELLFELLLSLLDINRKETVSHKKESLLPFSDMKHIDVEDGLMRVTGNEDLYYRIIMKFYDNNQNIVSVVKSTLESREFEDARRLVHTIKGVSGNIGAKSLSVVAQNLEYSVRDRKLEKLEYDFDAFEQEMVNVLNEIKPYKKVESSTGDKKSKQSGASIELKNHLEVLLPHMNKGDVKMCKTSISKINNKKWPAEFKKEIETLIHAVEKYRFESAEEIVISMLEKM